MSRKTTSTIRTKGTASREVEYDLMDIYISFESQGTKSREVIRKVTEECEGFLAELKKLGLDISSIKAGENHVWRDTNNERDFVAKRKIEWHSKLDVKMVDVIMKLSQKGSYSAQVTINPKYSEEAELHKELKKEAAIDAKLSADQLAEALGKKIEGPSKINASGDYDYMNDDEYMPNDRCGGTVNGILLRDTGASLFSELRNPTVVMRESIVIEWELTDR